MDPSDFGTQVAVQVTRDLIAKVVGPKVREYIGDFRGWNERRRANSERIFESAARKLGGRLNEDESVHPKVLKVIIDEGSFSEDLLTSEYFGGMLASARTGVERDDRGAVIAKLVSRLSVYDLRFHYIFYRAFRQVFEGTEHNIQAEGSVKFQIFIPAKDFHLAMAFTPDEDHNQILTQADHRLVREGLLPDFSTSYGSAEFLKQFWDGVTENGILVQPSILGMQLYLWSHGQGHVPIARFFDPAIVLDATKLFSPDAQVLPTPGACRTS